MNMDNSLVSGSLAMIQPAWHHVSGSNDHGAGELYQTSLMSALMAGNYEGQMTYGDIRKHGDFGLGTFNDLDGEMVGFDGMFYQVRSDGPKDAFCRGYLFSAGAGVESGPADDKERPAGDD
jgi:hypothetical protein